MPDHDLFLYTLGLLCVLVIGIAGVRDYRRERREERRFDLDYAKSRLNIDSVERRLADSEAAAITFQHQQHLNEGTPCTRK